MHRLVILTQYILNRRGKQNSGDLDIIVSSVQTMEMSDVLPTLLDRLTSEGKAGRLHMRWLHSRFTFFLLAGYIKHVLWKSLKGASTLKDRDQKQKKQKHADPEDYDYQITNKASRRSGFDDLAKVKHKDGWDLFNCIDCSIGVYMFHATFQRNWTSSRLHRGNV